MGAILIQFPKPGLYLCHQCGQRVPAVIETAPNSGRFVCANCLPPQLQQYEMLPRRSGAYGNER